MNGILIVDKPAGLTSHDVVHRVRRILQQREVGHLGTLDPLATGVLPIVLGNMTRLAQFYTGSEKKYEGAIRFGFSTDTYDAEGQPVGEPLPVSIDRDQLCKLAQGFQGTIEQIPPPFSAKKIAGVPAYKLARKKKDVPLKPVQVEIKQFEICDFNDSRAQFRAHVASGTYLRSIAHDLGKLAGCGAHLASLRRTAVAEFTLEESCTLDKLQGAFESREVESLLVHARKLLPQIPSVTATDDIASRIRHGQAVNLPDLSRAAQVKVFYGQRDLIAIATRIAGTLFHPKIVFT